MIKSPFIEIEKLFLKYHKIEISGSIIESERII